MSEHTGTLRVTIREAAARLDVTEGAIRKRIQRGSLPKEQGEDGRVYVYLPVSHDASREQSRTEPYASSSPGSDPRDQLIAHLRGEVEAWREESRRKDTIIMNMTEAMKALSPAVQEEEPPAESTPGAREYAVTPTPQPGRVEPQPSVESPQEPSESPEMHMPEAGGGPLPRDQQTLSSRRSWWRRMFGG